MAKYKCSKCKEKKDESEFSPLTDKRLKHLKRPVNYWCKDCLAKCIRKRRKKQKADNSEKFYKERNEAQRKFHKENPGKMREYFLKAAYGLTVEEYDKLFQQQNGVCAICGQKETSKNQYGVRRLNIDHNHKTKNVRGLLCSRCNLAIGQFNIDEQEIELLLKAIEYVRKYNEPTDPLVQ